MVSSSLRYTSKFNPSSPIYFIIKQKMSAKEYLAHSICISFLSLYCVLIKCKNEMWISKKDKWMAPMRNNRNTLSWPIVNNNDVTIRNIYLHKAVHHPTSSVSISALQSQGSFIKWTFKYYQSQHFKSWHVTWQVIR